MSLAGQETLPAISSPSESARTPWARAVDCLREQRSHSVILGGSVVMLIGSTVVSGFNFGYNVAVARMLGPAGFGHASAAATLLMLISAITLSFQLVCAKFVARNTTLPAQSAVYHLLRRRAWTVGLLLAAALAAGSPLLASYLKLPTSWLIVLLAGGIAFYPALGVKRGALQGTLAFRKLAANFVLEVVTKFIAAILLVWIGYGVMGAVGAITVSVFLAYLLPPLRTFRGASEEPAVPPSFHEGMQAIVFFVGQVIINNIDILLVKHFFTAQQAGLYAAVALVGRVLYFASWSVVSAMFPISAAGTRTATSSPAVLLVPLGMVIGIVTAFILVMTFFPALIVTVVFGAGFHSTEPLLSLYAAATGCYALSVVLMAYDMSRRVARTGWYQLIFSAALVVGISLFHSTLREVVVVQVVLMVVLLITVALPFFRTRPSPVQEAVA